MRMSRTKEISDFLVFEDYSFFLGTVNMNIFDTHNLLLYIPYISIFNCFVNVYNKRPKKKLLVSRDVIQD